MTERDSPRYVSAGGDLPLSNLGQLELLRAMMERGLSLRTPVRGFSMTPWILDEDVVTVAPMDDREPRLGQVVAFVVPATGKLALHRVIGRDQKGWVLRGDSCREADGVVTRKEMLGRVVRVERNGREVHFGKGRQGAAIAWLSRTGVLCGLCFVRRILRRFASEGLRHSQGRRLYRALGRRMAPEVAIVEAGEADLRAVRRWLNLEDLEDDSPPPMESGVSNLVAKRKGRIVGFVQLVHIGDPASPWVGHWLFSLTVRRRYRGLGIGEALTKRVAAEASAEQVSDLLLAVFEDNERAVRLYRKLGFAETKIDALEPMFEEERRLHGRRRVAMRKQLDRGTL